MSEHCNEPLMRRIIEQVREHPETIDMRWFHSTCSTTRCIAGWAQLLSLKNSSHWTSFSDAQFELELNQRQANKLFYAIADESGLSYRLEPITPAQAITAMENVIAYGLPSWQDIPGMELMS